VALFFLLVIGMGQVSRAGSILREVFQGIGGTAVSDLTNNPAYPSKPSATNYVTTAFEAPTDVDENYGQRMHGYVIPPVTGNYTFWIASDDGGALFLSKDENPATAVQIAYVASWTSSREWGREPNQQSAPIRLEAGRGYYISALQKEGGGGDNLAVRWLRPDGVDEGPIPATYLQPWGISFTPPIIENQPANTSAVEGQTATFTVTTRNFDSLAQWKKNGVAIPGMTGLTLLYGPVVMADNGAKFTVTLTNRLGSTNSTAATLTVLPDTTPPRVTGAINQASSGVLVTFSEPVGVSSGSVAANYAIDRGVTVTAATVLGDGRSALLAVSPMTFGTTYTVTVSGVTDRANTPNPVPVGSKAVFVARELFSQDIGATGGSIERIDAASWNLTGAGSDIGGNSDQFQYAWEQRTGNFDIQVRVATARMTDPFLHAGLMARGTLDAAAPFAAVFASSPQVGSFYESRATAGGATSTATLVGGFPVNPPQTWLRLRRVGNAFTGFGSLDGQTWVRLGSTTVNLPVQCYFGLALSGGAAMQASTAQFRDYGAAVSTVQGSYTSNREPLGPANRRTGIVFSEVMYHGRDAAGANRALEFVELYNADTLFEDLGGWQITGDITYTFPEGFVLNAGEFVAVAANPNALGGATGATGLLGPYFGNLGHSSGTLRLVDRLGAIKLDFTYGTQVPWPVAPDGTGHSLSLVRPSYGLEDPRAWGSSERVGGSPGAFDTVQGNPLADVMFNEILANPGLGQVAFVELYNHSNQTVDLSGCFLTDSPYTNRYRIPEGTVLAARGRASFDSQRLGFNLSPSGQTLFLVSSNQTRVTDSLRFGPQERGVAFGRFPDGSDTFRRLSDVTRDQVNAPWRIEDVVINELMYDPISGDSDDEFVELYNRSAVAVDVSGWRLDDAVTLKFPAGTQIAAGGYLVVGRNVDRLRTNHVQLNATNSIGNYNGSLRNSGDHLVLTKPQALVLTNANGNLVTNLLNCPVFEVAYVGGTGAWGRYSSGGGSSLELVDPRADPLRPTSWADSDESQKAAWATFAVTNTLTQGMGGFPPNRLHIGQMGMGEALVDDVEVIAPGGANVLTNPAFESGTTGWSFFGSHSTSTVDLAGGVAGSRCLHIRAQENVDTALNTIRGSVGNTLTEGNVVVMRAKARWVAGWPEVLLRLRGNWMDFPIRLSVPANLGTPGLPNSRVVPNAGPAIYAVTHTPALPRAQQSVVVTCRVSDPDGIASVNLRYRIDPSVSYATAVMRDDGTGGDAVAGDGVYSATITGRAAGALVGFNILAVDGSATSSASASYPTAWVPSPKPSAECLVRWDDPVPAGNFAHYHLWSSTATENLRGGSSALNNTYREGTLVYGNSRVIYQVGFRDKGSPYHGGGGSFAVINGEEEPLLGTTDRVFRSTGNGGPESTGLRNPVSAWIGQQMGIPHLHAHYMQLYRNGGSQYNVWEDEEAPSRYYADSWFPSQSEGDLYKIALWFEFQDDNQNFSSGHATLEDFRGPDGQPNRTRYRWNWQTRGYNGTENDFTNIFRLVALANDSTTNFVPNLLRDVDVDEWMRIFAYHRVLGNWDSYSFGVGQNMYLLKRPDSKYVLMPWDIDFTLGDGGGPSDGLWGGQDPVMNRWFDTPALRRMLWRAFIDAVNGPLDPARYQPVVDARRNALVKNGIAGLSAPVAVTNYMVQRRAFILNAIVSNDSKDFAITTGGGAPVTVTTPWVTVEGRAPFVVAALLVNGVEYPATWTSQNTFAITVPLASATNSLSIAGFDRQGSAVPGAVGTLAVNYTGAIRQPQDFIVISEIHYNPVEPGASFVEIYNNSTSTPFDLSGWRLEGVGLTFPDGVILPPATYGVVARDRLALGTTYGPGINVLAEYPGSLSNGGELLKLVKPLGLGGTNDLIVSDVRYDQRLPWPTNADGFGPSLQLIDTTRGTYRVGNWAVTPTNSPNRATPGRVNAVKASLTAFPTVWINEVLPNNVGGPVDGAGERDPYIEIYNPGPNIVALGPLFLTDSYTNLTRWAFPSGTLLFPGKFAVVWADGQTNQSTASEFHANFRLNPTNGSVAIARTQLGAQAVLDFVTYSQVPPGRSLGMIPDGEPRARRALYHPTPGATNDPAYPKIAVTINEFMASNTSTLTDPATGKADDWFELFNAGAEAVDLTGYTFSDEVINPSKYTVPSGFVIPPSGFLLVWADKATSANKTNPTDLHIGFKLSKSGGYLGMYGPDGAVVDAFSYGVQTPDQSQGRFPDGGDLPWATLAQPSPRSSNRVSGGNSAPVLASIPPQSIGEQQMLQFKVVGTDPDAGQTLAYSLVEDAPAGAEMEAFTGMFRWTPTEEQGPGTYSFTVRVTDNGIPFRSATQRVTVSVAEVNRAPVLPALSDRTVDEGVQLTMDARATDPDVPANTLVYSLAVGAPVGAKIDAATGLFTWTPSESQGPGIYPITVKVTDGGSPVLGDAKTFVVSVNEVNSPPVVDAIAPQTVDEGQTLSLTARAVDPDNPASAVAYSLEGDLPSGISIHPATGVIRWTPTESQGPGTFIIVVRATEQNPQHLSAAVSFGITVNEVNRAPKLAALPVLTVREGDAVSYGVQATDADVPAQGLSFALAAGSPAGASIDPQTGVFLWNAPDDVGPATNRFTVTVTDSGPGNLNVSGTLTVVSVPRFRAVINEVLYRPDATNAAFIELFNPSTITTQDLTGVMLSGENLQYAFPAGSQLAPGRFLVLAQKRSAFTNRYPGVSVFGEWSGSLGRFGTGLTLGLSDGAGGLNPIQRVDFRAALPWTTNADVPGNSLQLRDARRDGSRVGNWDAAGGSGWKYVVQTGTASSSSLYLYLENVGDAYIDNIQLVAGSVPEVGVNFLANGDFEGAFPGPFTVSANLSDSALSTAVKHGGQSSLHLISSAAGTTRGSSVYQDLATELTSGATYTLSYWYLPNPAGGTLTLRLSGSGIRSSVNMAPDGVIAAQATPGTTNSLVAALTEFPPVWINEMVPDNRSGLADGTGSTAPWVELINAGAAAVDLSGWTLSNNYTNSTAWSFPAGTWLPGNGYLVVFTDGKTANIPPGEWHTSFRSNPTNGVLVLSRPQLGGAGVVDYFEYADVQANQSFGLDPRGFPFRFSAFTLATPGAPNWVEIPAPQLKASLAPDGGVVIAWSAQIGASYRVEVRDSWAAPWQTLKALVADQETLSATDPSGVRAERYYRVVSP